MENEGTEMTVYAYLFEAKAIQSFILDSGKLRDLIGASELVDSLTEELLPVALRALEYQDEDPIRFSRRAGGALYAFADDKDALDRFTALWSLLMGQYAPELSFDVGRGDGDDAAKAIANARLALRGNTSRVRPALPVTAPITARSRRTGKPGVDREKEAVIDLPTKRKKAFANLARSGLTGRFSPDDANLRWRDWPRDLSPGEDGAFPFLGDDHTIALIHADGNGMGELLRHADKQAEGKPDEEYISIFRDLSETIAEVTQTAAKYATETVLMPEHETRRDPRQPDKELVLAARPIVLGGDDLTILVRADLALPFLRTFLEKFEDESEKQLPDLMIGAKRLTAGAGVVFLRASQPFYLATSLAESLAKLAKDHAKAIERHNPPSTLAFHRVTQSMIDDYPQIVEREKTILVDDVPYINTLGAYALRAGQGLPCLDDLVQLQILLQHEEMSRGPTRQLQTLMGLAPNQAETAYRRWRELMQENKAERLEEYHARMSALTDDYDRESALPYAHSKSTKNDRSYHSPIGDVLTLMAVKSAVPERTDSKPKESAA
jgi:hypothetical protein